MGVFADVLDEIVDIQSINKNLVCLLQPYSPRKIRRLESDRPSEVTPTPLYISTTKDLDKVCYMAEIVGWENKQDLTAEQLKDFNDHIRKFQPGEVEIYLEVANGKKCVNLVLVRNLKPVPNLFSVSNLTKISDSKPLKPRSRAGNWSYVYQLPEWLGLEETTIKEHLNAELEQNVLRSSKLDDRARRARLNQARKLPSQVQVISRAYKRNSDVIVESEAPVLL